MQASKRREYIIERLKESDKPVSATVLGEELSVSRQIIVGDIALIRASGVSITATPRGYVMQSASDDGLYTLACVHDFENMEKELNIMVDNGCTVVNVTVEHPLYGQLTGPLQLSSRYDVAQFMAACREHGASPLSTLTGGIHLHVLSCPDRERFERTYKELNDAGLIYTQQS